MPPSTAMVAPIILPISAAAALAPLTYIKAISTCASKQDLQIPARRSRQAVSPHFRNGATMSKSFQLSLAPEKLWQAINPWIVNLQGGQFGIINIDLGQTHEPELERAILDDVGSYGRQLGRIGDALEVLLRHTNQDDLSDAEQDTLNILTGQLAEIRKIKHQKRDEAPAGMTSPGSFHLSPSPRP